MNINDIPDYYEIEPLNEYELSVLKDVEKKIINNLPDYLTREEEGELALCPTRKLWWICDFGFYEADGYSLSSLYLSLRSAIKAHIAHPRYIQAKQEGKLTGRLAILSEIQTLADNVDLFAKCILGTRWWPSSVKMRCEVKPRALTSYNVDLNSLSY